MDTFHKLELPEPLKKALLDMKFTEPTPIQTAAIPIGLKGEDLVGCAQTGTGKTAAFCIPMITRLLANPDAAALILAPTRELAQQIASVVASLTKYTPELRHAVLVGGMSMVPQVRALRARPRILVCTPGRVLDHVSRKTLNLNPASILILDEVDRMLDIGFAPQLLQILEHLPKERQTLFFSATMPPEIERMAKKFSQNPKRVSVGEISKPVELIRQRVIELPSQEKVNALLDEINNSEGSVIVFVRTQRRTDRLADELEKFGCEVARIHGGRSQGQRNAAMAAFRAGDARILVATDVAARGIDISTVSRVVNFDIPQLAEDYVHRIGRTGRAGAEGEAITFVTPEERGQWKAISRFLEKKKALPAAIERRALSNSSDRPTSPAFRSDEGTRNSRSQSRPERTSREPREPQRRASFSDRPKRNFGNSSDQKSSSFRPAREGARFNRNSRETRNSGAPPVGGRWRNSERQGLSKSTSEHRERFSKPVRSFLEKPRTQEERNAYDSREPMFRQKSNDKFQKKFTPGKKRFSSDSAPQGSRNNSFSRKEKFNGTQRQKSF